MKLEWERMFSRASTECWTLRTDCFSISVLNNHRDCLGTWIMNCFVLGIDTKILKAFSMKEAKAESIKIVKDVVKKYVDDIVKICWEEPEHQELDGG